MFRDLLVIKKNKLHTWKIVVVEDLDGVVIICSDCPGGSADVPSENYH